MRRFINPMRKPRRGIRLQDIAREKLALIEPRYAKSAGTLLAYTCDEIYLTSISELGPVDSHM